MNLKQNIKIFCDFDGTIFPNDISDELFKKFGNFDININKLKNNEIGIHEYWKISFSELDFNYKEFLTFINQFEIDPNFIKFYNYCNINAFDFFIVSDGFRIYIQPLLEKYSLTEINSFVNISIFKDNKIIPEFRFSSESCNCFTALCKRNIILNNSFDEDLIIYIGDGISDFCASEYADIIFAKNKLAAHCNKNKIPHYPFKTFFDINRIMSNLSKKDFLKKRHQATLNRKSAFLTE